ncbi:MAG: Jag N-terminal domain-containing protein [Caldilineaceae bacterium]|nr:Jag N-terminal domain-containing protein [Caldilineaceae bacterium]
MSDSGEFSGRTIDDAIAEGLHVLGLTRAEADIEVLQHPRRKFLGRVEALVRISRLDDLAAELDFEDQQEVAGQPEPASDDEWNDWDTEDEEEEPPLREPQAAPVATEPDADARSDRRPRRKRNRRGKGQQQSREHRAPRASGDDRGRRTLDPETRSRRNAREMVRTDDYDESVPTPAGQEDNERIAIETLTRMLEYMGVEDFQVKRTWTTDARESADRLTLFVEGRHLGRLIGRRGATLQSMHWTLVSMMRRLARDCPKLDLDIDNYQLKQDAALQERALKTAADVVHRGRPWEMEPMTKRQRWVVHVALKDHPEVYTESEGTGSDRRVVILLK